MKLFVFTMAFGVCALAQEVPVSNSIPAVGTNDGPRIQFASTNYDFLLRWAGETIKYEFSFTNVGNKVLEISDVRTSCGCTTATNWQRRVEPGQTGIIPIQFNSANFNGPVTKAVSVTCNDPRQSLWSLRIQGTIKRAVELKPSYVYFNSTTETQTNEVRTVRITNNTDIPMSLAEPVCTNRAFALQLITIQPGKEFELRVTTQPPLPEGATQGQAQIKSQSTNFPTIQLNLMAMVQPVLRASPTEVHLPAGPLNSAAQRAITIRNNGANTVTYSDPAVNVEGVTIQTQPSPNGAVASFTLTFPEGFKAPDKASVEFTVKTSHPQKPVLHVPIKFTQFPGVVATRSSPGVTYPGIRDSDTSKRSTLPPPASASSPATAPAVSAKAVETAPAPANTSELMPPLPH
jgi:hypothetical protein